MITISYSIHQHNTMQSNFDSYTNKPSKERFGIIVASAVTVLIILLLFHTFIVHFLGKLILDQNNLNTNITLTDGQTIRIDRIIDGDTVEFGNNQRIRYLYMDTPETVKANTPVMCFGKEASNKNHELVENKEVTIKLDKEQHDQYGRTLAVIFLDKQKTNNIEDSLNYYMVLNGFARAVSYAPNITYKNEFLKAQQIAEKNKAGLWGVCPHPFVE